MDECVEFAADDGTAAKDALCEGFVFIDGNGGAAAWAVIDGFWMLPPFTAVACLLLRPPCVQLFERCGDFRLSSAIGAMIVLRDDVKIRRRAAGTATNGHRIEMFVRGGLHGLT